MKRVLKILLRLLLIAFVLIQFIRPPKNASAEIPARQITAGRRIPDGVLNILKKSCYDCHSNTTSYPWYWHVQPVAWYLDNHITGGKRHLNFSEFSSYLAWRQYKKLKEIEKEVHSGAMPMTSYTLIHRGTVLNADQKLAIENWAAGAMKEMEDRYPADSLERR
jgi:hypothetical protein